MMMQTSPQAILGSTLSSLGHTLTTKDLGSQLCDTKTMQVAKNKIKNYK